MAICVVDQSTWTDSSLNLEQKFEAAEFWDHNGWDGISKGNCPRRPESWPKKLIRKIDSVELLGITSLSDVNVEKGKLIVLFLFNLN
jgi:hypothetical protein